MNLSEPFIRRPVMTMVVTVSAILFGILSFTRLPVDALPSVDYPIIVVNAAYPGASPETMASTVATPLERQFMQINGLELVTSKSTQGHTALTLQFALEKSLDAAATDVQTAISQATPFLPSDMPSPPTFSKNNPNDQPLMYIAITSDTVTKGKLYDYASTQLGQKLSILPGVSRVQIFGAKSAIRIKVDPSALAARRLTVDDVSDAIRRGTSSVGAGQLDGSAGSSLLRPLGQLDSVDGYRNLIVSSLGTAPVYLSDVAEVVESLEDERINLKFWVRDREVPPATLVAAVTRRAGANAVEVAQSIRRELPVISATLPSSVLVTPIYDRSWSIVQSVADVEETLIIAFVLVVLVIFVFLGRATDTLIPAVAMPLSLLLTFIAMRLLGYSIDNLSLMALTLAIGFLVDDAIVFLENTVRRMERGERAMEAAIHGAKEISFTILSMTVSLAAVFIPLVFMSGQVGRVFREFAVTIVIAILASGIVSLTLTPLMCARMLRDRGPGTKRTFMERVFGAVERRVLAAYGASLSWFLRWKFISAVVWAACLAGTVFLFMSIPKSMLPAGDSSVVFGVFIAREGSSPEQMKRYQDQVLKVFESDPDVLRSITITGATGFLNSNMGLTFTFLKPPNERKPIPVKAGELMGRIAQIPGLVAGLQPWAVLEIQAGAVSQNQGQYSYAISGVNPQEVYETAGKMMMGLFPIPGTPAGKLFDSMLPDLWANTPNLDVSIRREQAKSQGVSEARILSLLQTAYAQNYVYLIKKPEDQYQVIVEVADEARAKPDDLGLLYIRSDDGRNLVPLSALVDWKQTVGLQAVNHINQFTSVTFSLNIKPGVALGDATAYVDQLASQVVPPTLRKGFQGQAETFQATMSDLTILLYLAVFVMYVILAILYESYIHPITVLSTLPPALVGGLLALWVFNEQATLYAFVGLFMLMGIVKKNGIMIVDFARHRVDAGEPADKAIHDASMDRFRPIIMTTLAAVMGAVPIALGYGADGASRRPLGLVIVGGLIVSQFITLFVTPVIYLYMESFQKKVLDRIPFFRSHPAPAAVPVAARDESLEVSLSPEAKSHGR